MGGNKIFRTARLLGILAPALYQTSFRLFLKKLSGRAGKEDGYILIEKQILKVEFSSLYYYQIRL